MKLLDLGTALYRRFRSDRSGQVALTFALAAIPMLGLAGLTMDYGHASFVKTDMQAALDATALAMSQDAVSMTSSQLQSAAQNYFNAQFQAPDAKNTSLAASYSTSGGSTIVLSATTTVPTYFMDVMGFKSQTVSASSTVKWGSTRLRVALVLDNTGSMADSGKMTALQTATKNLLTQLQSAASSNGDVYVSIIPFVRDVNLNASNYNASWIDWTSWAGEPPYIAKNKPSNWGQIKAGSSCPFSNSNYGFGCKTGPSNSASTTSTIPSSGTYKGYICPSVDSGGKISTQTGVYYNGCYTSPSGSSASCGSNTNCACYGSGSSKVCHAWVNDATANAKSTWTGCVVDRGDTSGPDSGNYDTNIVTPTTSITATLFPAQQYNACPQAAVGLNYNWSNMTTIVNNMTPNGSTNQAIGLVQGWMSLAGGGPFTVPAMDPNYTYSQVIILLTDGLNTQDRWYGDGSDTSTQVDARQTLTCSNIKAANITLYTVEVSTDGTPVSTLLQNCASSSTKFFYLTSASQIVTTFNTIGTNLSNLYVAK